jgi:hypothetical protein
MRRLLARITGWIAATIDGPRTIGATVRGRPLLWLFLCGVLLTSAILVGTAVMIGQFRERALTNGERELANTVLLLTRHFDRQFEDSDLIAHNIIAQMGITQMTAPEQFRQKAAGFSMHELLKSRVGMLSHIGDINLFDAEGRLINSSGSWPLPDVDISDRDYFSAMRSNPQRVSALVGPVRSYFTGGWTTIHAHRVTGADGSFLGVIARRIDPDTFEKSSPRSCSATDRRFPCSIATEG